MKMMLNLLILSIEYKLFLFSFRIYFLSKCKCNCKGSKNKNSSTYFDNKMIEEEEMEKQIDDGTFDECAYVKDDDDLCA